MPKTLIEQIEELQTYDTIEGMFGVEFVTVPPKSKFPGTWIDSRNLRAIIEQYKTEGDEPHPPSRLCMCADCAPSFVDDPSPTIVGELVKALEKLTRVCRRQFDTKRIKDGVILQEAEALLARAKAMAERRGRDE